MKTFSYTSRDRDGRLKKGTVQAADRAGAMREVRAAGGVPLSVAEARPGAGAGAFPVTRRAMAFAAALLVAAAAAGVFLLAPRGKPAEESQAAAQQGKPAGKPAGGAGVVKPPPTVAPTVEEGLGPRVEEGGAHPAGVRPAAGGSGGAAAPAAEAAGYAENVSLVFVTDRKEPLFRREAEQMLALYVQPGQAVPPTPFGRGFEEDALAALAEDIVVTAEDSPEDVERKELVAWMKEDMRRHLAGGGTVAEFFALMERRQEEEAGLLQEARRLMHEFAREGDRDGALAAHRALNEVLAEKGIAPLPLPGLLRRAGE